MIVRIWGIGRLGAVGSLGEEEGCFGGGVVGGRRGEGERGRVGWRGKGRGEVGR